VESTQQLLRCWREAAADLGIEVTQLDDAIVVPRFGSEAGMLCATLEGQRELRRRAEELGMGWSALGAAYLRYDRELFIETLDDWGWCGEAPAPPWYSGEHRTSRVPLRRPVPYRSCAVLAGVPRGRRPRRLRRRG
jgi:hypothetical protein